MAATQAKPKAVVPAKIGFFGGTGSGKTTTTALLAIGLSKSLHGGAPVYVYDTEPGWQFMRRPFVSEGIELIQHRERSFQGMRRHLKEAEKQGACVFVVDSMTHIWNELMQTFQNTKSGKVEFQSFNLIKRHWNEWTIEFLNSPLHCFALGRMGYEYESEINEKGKREIVKGDSKFKAGGGESFGYEPHMLVEMELQREDTHSGKGGTLVHIANVLKDRTRILNGETFEFRDIKGYKAGDYKAVYETFLPHVEELQFTEGLSTIASATSAELKPESESSWYRAKQDKEVAIEKIEATMTVLWPGQDKDSKQIKIKALECVFGTRSWKELTESLPVQTVQDGAKVLAKYEELSKTETPTGEEGVMSLLGKAKSAIAEEIAEQVF